jgi:hypothetical protein
MITNINEFKKINESRQATDDEQEVMSYLNSLRNYGRTNMYQSLPYVLKHFPDLKKDEASRIIVLWMDNFNEKGDYTTIQNEDYDYDYVQSDDIQDNNTENWIELEKKFMEFSSTYPKEQYPSMRQTFNFIKNELF